MTSLAEAFVSSMNADIREFEREKHRTKTLDAILKEIRTMNKKIDNLSK